MSDRASRFVTFKAPGTSIGGKDGIKVLIFDAVRIVDGFGGWEVISRPRKTAMTLWTGFQPLTLEIPIFFHTNSKEFDDGARIEADCIALGQMAGRGEPSPEPQRNKNNKVILITVKKGDTWAKIANTRKVDLANLLQLNNAQDPAKITVGKKIKLPQAVTKEPFGEPPVIELTADGSVIPYNDLGWDEHGLERKQWVISNIEWEGSTRNIYGYRIRQHATVTVMQYVSPEVAITKPAPWRRNTRNTRTKPTAKGK